VKHLDVVTFNPREQNYFSRSPVSSDAEAIYVKDYTYEPGKSYRYALLASGFRQNKTAFTPCPLGTFTNPLTKGVDGCEECKPGNILASFFKLVRRCQVTQLIFNLVLLSHF